MSGIPVATAPVGFVSRRERELRKQQLEEEEAYRKAAVEAEQSRNLVVAPPEVDDGLDPARADVVPTKRRFSEAYHQQLGEKRAKHDTSKQLTQDVPEEESGQDSADKELEQIRLHYLGVNATKKKMQKPSEKFRNIFQFDWDYEDDTTKAEYNPIYSNKHEPQLLFGRGYRAGLDFREQRRRNQFYDSLAQKRQERLAELRDKGYSEAEIMKESLAVTSLLDVNASEEQQRAAARMHGIKPTVEATQQEAPEERERHKYHWSEKRRDLMTERDWRIFREDFNITIKGAKGRVVPYPARNWEEMILPRELLEAVRLVGYQTPTPIQMQAIPIAMGLCDVIGIAETGSGKTAAFMLPMLTYVRNLPRLNDESAQAGPYGLVLVPARELAIQIGKEGRKFCEALGIRILPLVGGHDLQDQAIQLRKGVEIVVGTPGRIHECLEKALTTLMQCNYIVLDEADRMIDLGFEKQVNWILDQIPSTKQDDEIDQKFLRSKAGYRQHRLTQMFSATMPPSVERLARDYLRSPITIQIGNPGEGKKSIEQVVEMISEKKKLPRLNEVVAKHQSPIIVFVNQKRQADMIARQLQRSGHSAVAFHGGKAQGVREESLEAFRNGEADVLVATDVAGRGIDIQGVRLVINCDMPKDIETYTHRIGRTGRAGKKGKAVSFLTDEDAALFFDLKAFLVATENVVPKELDDHPASKVKTNPMDTGKMRPPGDVVIMASPAVQNAKWVPR